MNKIDAVNAIVQTVDTNQVSDGYHTFGELYEHRIGLFITLCRVYKKLDKVRIWRSERHSDGTIFDGWFVMGIGWHAGKQITYHIPMSKWKETFFAETLERAPHFDGHTPNDVIERLKFL